MKISGLLFVSVFWISNCLAQNNYTVSSGESPIHKKSDDAKALNEAIMDAQTNAVIAYGGNVNVMSVSKKVEVIESKRGVRDKKYKTSGSFTENNKFYLQNSVSAIHFLLTIFLHLKLPYNQFLQQ